MQVLSRQPHYYLYINILLNLLMNGKAVAHYVYDRQPDSSNNGKFGYVLILAILRMIDYYRWMKIK